MPEEPLSPPSVNAPRSLAIFRAAPPELQELIKKIMAKERLEKHKKNRTDIYQTLLQYIRESVQ